MVQETNFCASCVPEAKGKPWWILIEESPKWLRVKVGDHFLANSKHALIVNEAGRLPVYYFPIEDLDQSLLRKSESTMFTEHKGQAEFYDIVVDGREIKDAIWGYPHPHQDSAGLKGFVAIDWKSADQWFEEEEEIFVHARDPYTRIDTIGSSRHVVVKLNGEIVADSVRPVILFETGLTPRYYLPAEDIRFGLFTATDSVTRCPYKGFASYWTADVNGKTYEDVLWSYQDPIPEVIKIKGPYSFYNEYVDELLVDDVPWKLAENNRLPFKGHSPSDLDNK